MIRDLLGALVGLLSLVLLAVVVAGCGRADDSVNEIARVGDAFASSAIRKHCDGTTAVYVYGAHGIAAVPNGCVR